MSADLKPCPFCGDANLPFTYEDWPDWYVQCDLCDARTGTYFTEAEAIKAWNTRAPVAGDVACR